MRDVCNKMECTGCSACINICPSKCIEMEIDDMGFAYPHVHEDRCVNCNLCRKVCPCLSEQSLHSPIEVFAAISNNSKIYQTATSGGIATTIAKQVLMENGVVYGAAFEDSFSVCHQRVTTLDGLDKLKGSKYVQSEIRDSFSQIKHDLDLGKIVLFIGTPCQCAGLRSFLKRDYLKLYICDIVCHGVPSVKMLKEHLDAVTNNMDIDSVTFRNEQGFQLSAYSGEKCIYSRRSFFDVFYLGFLKCLFYRESCFECRYATSSRVGDLTLGAFWGFDRQKEDFPVKTNYGLSLILVNTDRGSDLLSKCKDDIISIKRELAEAIAGNSQLQKPSKKNRQYKLFKKMYRKYGFERAAAKALAVERLKHWILAKMGY